MALVALAAALWVSVLAFTPSLPVPAAALVYLFGSRICHQVAERSFHLWGAQLPVCARCAGIYLGVTAGAVLWTSARRRVGNPPVCTGGLPVGVAAFGLLAVGLNGASIAIEQAGWWYPTNGVRAMAGGVLGAAAVLAAGGALHYTSCRTRSFAPVPPATRI